MKLYDKEGNEYTFVGGHDNTIIIEGTNGKKEVQSSDLNLYSAYPPEVTKAIRILVNMLKDGEITPDDLRKLRDGDSTKEYSDGEIIGIDNDGCLILWNSTSQQGENCGETPEQYGIDNISRTELKRIDRER